MCKDLSAPLRIRAKISLPTEQLQASQEERTSIELAHFKLRRISLFELWYHIKRVQFYDINKRIFCRFVGYYLYSVMW
jgi:hypothetical protein